MVRASLLLTILVAAACGDNNGHKKTDAAVNPDTPEGIDAAVDAGPDASPDAPPDSAPPAMSRVWAVGDFLTDLKLNAGGFTDGDTLPFGPATPPPIVLPGGTSVLATGAGYQTSAVFDASRDGTKIAFVADLTTAGAFDIYVANADGSNPTKLVDAAVGVEYSAVALSPDGTKLAYLADATVNGGYDLYIVNTTGTPAPVRITMTPSAAQDVFFQLAWSADSKYVAFSADMTTDGFDQAYAVDTTATTPTAVELLAKADIATQASGAQGVRGGLQFDAADNVYFRARVTAGRTQFQLFQAKPDGSMRTDITSVAPARADTTTPDIGAFALSPDGATLVFSADAPVLGADDLYAVSTTTLANPTKITALTAAGHADFTGVMQISPDGTQIAYVANFLSTRNEPFVSAIDGSGTHRLVSLTVTCAGCTSPDANAVQWTADSKSLYVTGDLTSNNDTKLYKLDPAMTDQTPVLAVDVPTGGDMTAVIVRQK